MINSLMQYYMINSLMQYYTINSLMQYHDELFDAILHD